MKEKKFNGRKHLYKNAKKVRVRFDMKVERAFDYLYLFEGNCPKIGDIDFHIRAIEEILNDHYFISKGSFIDEILGYECYLTGYSFEERVKKNEKEI